MSIALFDIQSGFGGGSAGRTEIVSPQGVVSEMQRLGIDKSLVRIVPEDWESDVPRSNEKLYEANAQHTGLVPCPIIFPSENGDDEEQLDRCIAHGAGAVSLRPSHDHWLVADWVCDRMFLALQDRRMPAFCLQKMISIEVLADLAGSYLSLPFILAEVGYRNQRTLLALLESFPNIYLSIGSCYTVHKGIEQMVERVGAERLLFGTGFPEAEPMAAITQLTYADISDEQKQLIGSRNMDRLIGGIVR